MNITNDHDGSCTMNTQTLTQKKATNHNNKNMVIQRQSQRGNRQPIRHQNNTIIVRIGNRLLCKSNDVTIRGGHTLVRPVLLAADGQRCDLLFFFFIMVRLGDLYLEAPITPVVRVWTRRAGGRTRNCASVSISCPYPDAIFTFFFFIYVSRSVVTSCFISLRDGFAKEATGRCRSVVSRPFSLLPIRESEETVLTRSSSVLLITFFISSFEHCNLRALLAFLFLSRLYMIETWVIIFQAGCVG